MNSRRLLFVDAPRKAGAAPIYLAIAALVLVSLVGFLVAVRGEDSQASGYRPTDGDSGPVSQSLQEGPRLPLDTRESGGHAHWM